MGDCKKKVVIITFIRCNVMSSTNFVVNKIFSDVQP